MLADALPDIHNTCVHTYPITCIYTCICSCSPTWTMYDTQTQTHAQDYMGNVSPVDAPAASVKPLSVCDFNLRWAFWGGWGEAGRAEEAIVCCC